MFEGGFDERRGRTRTGVKGWVISGVFFLRFLGSWRTFLKVTAPSLKLMSWTSQPAFSQAFACVLEELLLQ